MVCSIGNSRVIWFDGPWKSSVPDCSISRRSQLRVALPGDERLLADKGYRHDARYFICPVTGKSWTLDLEDRARNFMIYSARQTVERIFCRIKKFGFWTLPWRASIGLHALCARVIAKLVNFHLIFEPLWNKNYFAKGQFTATSFNGKRVHFSNVRWCINFEWDCDDQPPELWAFRDTAFLYLRNILWEWIWRRYKYWCLSGTEIQLMNVKSNLVLRNPQLCEEWNFQIL